MRPPSVPPAGECCVPPPAVMAFNPAGDLLHAWGVPNSVPGWPKSEHTIFTDRAGSVYIGGAQAGDGLMRFTADGKFISDFGHRGPAGEGAGAEAGQSADGFAAARCRGRDLDEDAHELYIADGYLNRRVIVFDSDTGKFKRGWGAYGKPLSEIDNNPQPPHDPKGPPAAQYKSPVHCVRISNDGLLYVCDRGGDRIQVFTKQGRFLKEFFIANETLRGGAAGSVDFSPDPEQKYIFVADIVNNVVWELERDTGKIVDKIGHAGHAGGQFHFVHVATMDSKGNLYTGEVDSGNGCRSSCRCGSARKAYAELLVRWAPHFTPSPLRGEGVVRGSGVWMLAAGLSVGQLEETSQTLIFAGLNVFVVFGSAAAVIYLFSARLDDLETRSNMNSAVMTRTPEPQRGISSTRSASWACKDCSLRT